MTHCPAHWDEHLRWLDRGGPAAPRLDGLRLHTIGGDRPRDVAEGTRLRAARRYAIIRAQHAHENVGVWLRRASGPTGRIRVADQSPRTPQVLAWSCRSTK